MTIIDREKLKNKVAQYKGPYRRKTTFSERFAVEATKGDIYRMILEEPEVRVAWDKETLSYADTELASGSGDGGNNMFIQLTRHDGQPVYVNTAKIETIIPYQGFTSISIGTTTLDVKDSTRDIFRLIEG